MAGLSALAMFNVVMPAGAGTVLSVASCDLGTIRGGVDWVMVLDASCSLAGLGALFLEANIYAMAFCAGWGFGRFLGEAFDLY
jgi:hypothetical protein